MNIKQILKKIKFSLLIIKIFIIHFPLSISISIFIIINLIHCLVSPQGFYKKLKQMLNIKIAWRKIRLKLNKAKRYLSKFTNWFY